MKVITLISDWKLKDPYVAIFKAKLASTVSGAQQYDITHAIDLFNIEQTAFILKSSYKAFPDQTLHIILTDAPMSHEIFPVLVEYDRHYFLGADNGVFTMMFGNLDQCKAYQYHPTIDNNGYTDKILEMTHWFFTNQLEDHTSPYAKFTNRFTNPASYDPIRNRIVGTVAYIDSVFNAVTNIPIEMFEQANKENHFEGKLPVNINVKITKCLKEYSARENDIVFTYNQLGYLEISMFRSNVAILAEINVGDIVEIQF